MNFVGTGKRLTQGDIGEAARAIGIETAVLLAFLEVEAAGRGFDNRNRLKMLRETHKFYAELKNNASKLATAIAAGLATKSWTRNYKSDSYPDLERMIAIGGLEAALRSCSWGLPQILGSNHKDAGFASAEQMVKTMLQGEREQLFAMVTLMKAWGMHAMLTGRDFTKPDSWRAAAKKYNGAGYAANNYHVKLANAYIKHKRGTSVPMSPADKQADILHIGMKGEVVRNLQNDLAYLGYKFTLGIDGRYGNETRDIVKAFQKDNGVTPFDGVAGSKTLAAIDKAIAAAKVDHSPEPPEWDRGIRRLLQLFINLLKGK